MKLHPFRIDQRDDLSVCGLGTYSLTFGTFCSEKAKPKEAKPKEAKPKLSGKPATKEPCKWNSICRSKSHGRIDVVIVGAGVAGSALAYALGKDGRRMHVIERDWTMHNRMIWEVLKPGGYLKLLELGLEDCVLDIEAQQVFGYVIYKDGKYIRLPYPLNSSNSNVTERSFHNELFVQRLREKAASLPKIQARNCPWPTEAKRYCQRGAVQDENQSRNGGTC